MLKPFCGVRGMDILARSQRAKIQILKPSIQSPSTESRAQGGGLNPLVGQ